MYMQCVESSFHALPKDAVSTVCYLKIEIEIGNRIRIVFRYDIPVQCWIVAALGRPLVQVLVCELHIILWRHS